MAALGIVAAAAFGAARLARVVSPLTLAGFMTHPPSAQGERFPSRTLVPSVIPRPARIAPRVLPDRVPWRDSEVFVSEFLTESHTNAFVVLRGGDLVHEWYRDGFDVQTRSPSWSVAKSIVSLLIGQAIGRGELSENDRLVDLLPELRTGSDYDSVTVRHLLDMASGIDVTENYNPWFPFRGTAHLMLTTDLAHFVRAHRGTTFAPGSWAEYRSIDTQLLGTILRRITGTDLTKLLQDGLWDPLGAEYSATWNTDRDGGQEKAFCGINATARDFAKIGQLMLDEGRVGESRIVPSSWIERIRTPRTLAVEGWGYSAQWWHLPGGNGSDFTAIGIHGQYIFVDPANETVIVKLSDHGTEQDEQATIDVFRFLAANLGAEPGAQHGESPSG